MGGTSHYAVQIDSSPPAIFTLVVEPAPRTIERQPLVSFITTDALSGISHYELRYIDITPERKEEAVGFFREVSSPYKLPALAVGKYLIVIRAYDMAGNWREGTAKVEILPEGIFFTGKGVQYRRLIIPWWLLVLILIIVFGLIFRSLWKKYKNLSERRKTKLAERNIKLET